MSNTATVTASEFDPVTTNNASTADQFNTASIPTLSEWGLIALTLFLALAGAFVLRRQI